MTAPSLPSAILAMLVAAYGARDSADEPSRGAGAADTTLRTRGSA